MSNPRVTLSTVVLLTIFLLSASWWGTQAAQPPAATPAKPVEAQESVEVRLAEAHLRLAKLDLSYARAQNKLIPKLFPTALIEKLALHVMIDQAHVEECRKGIEADAHEVCLQSAKVAVKIAESDLKRKDQSQARIPSDRGKMEVERAKLVKTIAELNLVRLEELESSESVMTHLQWQIDELRHELLELQMRVAAKY